MGWHREEEKGGEEKERVRRSESAAWLACPPHFASRLRTDSSCKAPNLRENFSYASTASSQSIGVHTAHRRPAHVLRVHDGPWSLCDHVCFLHGTALQMHLVVIIAFVCSGGGWWAGAFWPCGLRMDLASERSRGYCSQYESRESSHLIFSSRRSQ